MSSNEKMIPEEEALKQLNLALRRAALIYHHFAETLVDELGEEKGMELVRKTIDAYGDHVGKEAKKKAQKKGLHLTPENFQDDLPMLAWDGEEVEVDGEKRVRVHHCPLAAEWLEWGDAKKARVYCYVDQAKMHGFNPDYEYVHIKNILDGDPYCELAVRPVKKEEVEDKEAASEEETEDTVWWISGRYTRDDLMAMDPECLRALFRERVHHTVEVDFYPILLGEKKARPKIGREPQLILDVWKKRGFSDDEPDFEWGKAYLDLAEKLREGKEVKLDTQMPVPFTESEMKTVRKLIWDRCSIRDWIPGKEVPDEMIEQILEAGRAAPTGCNLDVVRFVVIRDPDKAKMVWSDIPTPMDRCVLIVVCYDKRIYKTVGHDKFVGHNQLLDGAAAIDHMCLMAHALGLGATWLTCFDETVRKFKEQYGLPDYIEQVCHMAVGWPAMGTIKSARMPLKEMLID
ncbi:nitroreductase family protein [Acidobacteriota bacterium]